MAANARLRVADITDAKMLFEWRNDPATRAASHNTESIEFSDHARWLESSLANSSRCLLVFELGGVPVATVRLDGNNNSVELSWTVAPDARGKGIAKAAVLMAVDQYCRGKEIHAEVKEGNIASIKVAEAAGMRLKRTEGNTLYFERDH